MDWKKQAMRRAESFLNWEDGLPLHSHDARMLAQDLKDALAEVERLRDVVRQVHGLVARVQIDWDSGLNRLICNIRDITKGMVE